MALTMWGQVIVQAATPGEDPVQIGTIWVDTSGTPSVKVCTAVSPYTFATLSSGTVAAHNHTSSVGDGGVLTNDAHDGYIDIADSAAPSAPSAGTARLYAETSQGHTQLHLIDEDGTHLRVNRDAVLIVRNTSGGDITKGQTLDIYDATGGTPEVRLADANASPPRHAEGFAMEDIANNGYGLMLLSGEISGLDTSLLTEGAELYQGTTPGGYTETAPTDGSLVQSLGVVSRSHATQGSIEAIIALPLIHAAVHKAGGVDAIRLDDLEAPEDNTDLNATTSQHGLLIKATAPASGLLSALGIGNGETVYSMKPLFDTTNPANLGTVGPGTALVAARRDHIHARQTNIVNAEIDAAAAIAFSKLDVSTQYRARAYNSAAQSVNNAALTAMTLDTEDYDVGGLHSTSSNTSRMTVPTGGGGLYLIIGKTFFTANATGAVREVRITKNGAAIGTSSVNVPSGVTNEQFEVVVLEVLAAADYIELVVYQDSGGALNVGAASRQSASELSIVKLW